jgi:hypothetical protein
LTHPGTTRQRHLVDKGRRDSRPIARPVSQPVVPLQTTADVMPIFVAPEPVVNIRLIFQ